MKNNRKGQLTLEFIGTALIFLTIMAMIAVSVMEPTSTVTDQSEDFQKNLEAKEITTEIITTTGLNTDGNEDWRQGDELQSFGLADSNNEFMTIKEEKLDGLNSFNDPGGSGISYSDDFVDLTDADNQYQFNFTWFPTVTTFDSFRKVSPPQEPFIREPTGAQYDSAGDRVHYGNTSLMGNTYNFLVTSQDGEYSDVYINDSWDFRGIDPISQGEESSILPGELSVRVIQNQPDKPGTMVMFEGHEKRFGAQRDVGAATFKFNRYAVYVDDNVENHPMRMEVYLW